MAGRNFLFVPGPTNLPDRIQRAMMISMEDHRSPIFPRLYESLLPGLKRVFRTETGFLSFFLHPARVVGKLLSQILYLPVIKFWPPVSDSSVISG